MANTPKDKTIEIVLADGKVIDLTGVIHQELSTQMRVEETDTKSRYVNEVSRMKVIGKTDDAEWLEQLQALEGRHDVEAINVAKAEMRNPVERVQGLLQPLDRFFFGWPSMKPFELDYGSWGTNLLETTEESGKEAPKQEPKSAYDKALDKINQEIKEVNGSPDEKEESTDKVQPNMVSYTASQPVEIVVLGKGRDEETYYTITLAE